MVSHYSLTRDPVFFVIVGFFALLTTALPAGLGQARFLPIIQTISLTIFVGMAVRRREAGNALAILALWLAIQIAAMIALTWLAVNQADRAFVNGFAYRGAIVDWFYADGSLPAGLASEPISRLIEIVGVLFGSSLSGGLIGVWFLVRAANLTGYSAGALLLASGAPVVLFAALPLWTLLRIAGYAGLVTLLAEPLLTSNWTPGYYLTTRRRLLLVSVTFVIASLLLELSLPSFWRALFR
jgi:hypothetical protein